MADKLDNISYGKPSAGQIPLKAYQSSNSAKVRNDTKTTKSKLRRLAKKWKGVNSVYGFLTELWIALGVNNQSENPLSKIALSLVGYLTNGRYVETTGVAIQHQSPPRQSPERDVQVETTCRSAPLK